MAANGENKEMKQNHEYLCTHSRKERTKPQFFTDGMIMYVEILKQSTEPWELLAMNIFQDSRLI